MCTKEALGGIHKPLGNNDVPISKVIKQRGPKCQDSNEKSLNHDEAFPYAKIDPKPSDAF